MARVTGEDVTCLPQGVRNVGAAEKQTCNWVIIAVQPGRAKSTRKACAATAGAGQFTLPAGSSAIWGGSLTGPA